jgi:hypothetical protein
MSTQKRIACACVALGVCAAIAIWLAHRFGLLYPRPVVRDTPFTREYDQVYRLTGKLVRSELPPPKGPDSKRVEAFVAAGILSTNDEAYIREHGIEFHGFDGTRTGADVVVLETVCNRTKPPRRITGYADCHAEYRELTHEP